MLQKKKKKKKKKSENTPTKVVLGVGNFGKGYIIRIRLKLRFYKNNLRL
jgi:hypothetical protein